MREPPPVDRSSRLALPPAAGVLEADGSQTAGYPEQKGVRSVMIELT